MAEYINRELSDEELDVVTGGVVYSFMHDKKGLQTWDLRCRVCGSPNNDLVQTSFASFKAVTDYLCTTKVRCRNCGHVDYGANYFQKKVS